MSVIGVDIGSSYLSVVETKDETFVPLFYAPHKGNFESILKELNILNKIVIYTGNNSFRFGGRHPFFPLIQFSRQFRGTRHIIYVGAGSYFIVNLDEDGNYVNHISNSTCASGTGSFLDLQARRLGYGIEELGEKALNAKVSPSISTRCSVFAKTDLIHLQQEGYTKEEIASGLCKSLAENLIDNLFKGNKPSGKILVAGGVFLNKALLNVFINKFGRDNIICESPNFALAIGAAIIGKSSMNANESSNTFSYFLDEKHNLQKSEILLPKEKFYPDFSAFNFITDEFNNEITIYNEDILKTFKDKALPVYMGIDIGSTSTKICLIDADQNVLLGIYRKTASEPINAVKQLFRALQKLESNYNLSFDFKGVATTGSGRKMIKEVVSADDAINEITAHAIAAAFIDKDTDTIIEIGGQDSKFTKLSNGIVTYSVMNYVCAAGTGSFVEEQAEKLGINISNFSKLAENRLPPPTSDRCTVFMEKDIDILVASGVPKEDITAAVLVSVRDNYLNKVVGNVPMGNKIYFQGATAKNRSLVAAFEQRLGQTIYVSPYCHITGALGCAIHIKNKNLSKTSFTGLSFSDKETNIEKEVCELCVNKCALSIISTEEDRVAWGMKCGRDYNDNVPKKIQKNQYIQGRNDIFLETSNGSLGKIVVPDFLANSEKLDFLYPMLSKLGFVVDAVKPNKNDYENGRKRTYNEICAPCVVTFGAISQLKDVNIFMPHFLRNLVPEGISNCHLCPLTQAMPSIIKTIFKDKTVLSPKMFETISIERQSKEIFDVLKTHYQISIDDIKTAISYGYEKRNRFKASRYEKGKKFLDELKEDEIGVIVIGRPYILYNQHLNHGLIDILSDYGIKAIPVDCIDPNYHFLKARFPHIYWNYGQIILSSLKVIAEKKNLFPLFFTCFSCGPDSFVLNYFYKEMETLKKPYLSLQFDGHSAATGYITRIEAAIDSFRNYLKMNVNGKLADFSYSVPDGKVNGRKVLIPPMDIEGAKLVAASFKRIGIDADVLNETNFSFKEGLKHSIGHECSPYHSTLGALISKLKSNGNEKFAYFMPTGTGPCRFGQYSVLQNAIIKELGYEAQVISPSGENAYSGLPIKLRMIFFDAIIMNDILRKIVLMTRPYERKKGETDKIYNEILFEIRDAIANKGDYITVFDRALKRLKGIRIRNVKKPKVGIVGEIYVRSNAFLNDYLINAVEQLGGVAFISSFSEWFFYTLYSERLEDKLINNKSILNAARLAIKNRYYNKREHFFYNKAKMYFNIFEPSIEDVIAKGSEYLPTEFQGEAILTVGRASIFFERENVDLVVNASPTFCMPGTLSSYLLKDLEKRFRKPVVNLFYDKTGKPNLDLVPYLEIIKAND